jgi:integrase
MARVYQLPSGKWHAVIRRKGLKAKFNTFPLKRDALAWASIQESQIKAIVDNGFQPVPNGYTLAHLIDAHIKETTPEGRSKLATMKMLSKKLGQHGLADISAITLRDFVTARRKDGAGGVTIATDLSMLGTVYKYGRHALLLDIDPDIPKTARADLKARGMNTRSTERTRLATDTELEALYADWAANELLQLPMVDICKFALATTMRQDEICSLMVADINIEKKTVLIRDRKHPSEKVGNNQTVPLLPEAWAIVKKRLETKKDGLLFGSDSRSVSARFTRTCQKLKIIDLHFHDLRHTAITNLFKMGFAIQEVALFSGHKDWKMLARYTHVSAADVQAKFEKLSNGN